MSTIGQGQQLKGNQRACVRPIMAKSTQSHLKLGTAHVSAVCLGSLRGVVVKTPSYATPHFSHVYEALAYLMQPVGRLW